MFVTPTAYVAGRRVRLGGTQYAPGDPIPDEYVLKARNIDTLLSLRYVVPTPDPHGRKGKETIPTPVSTPATVRRAIRKRAEAVPPPEPPAQPTEPEAPEEPPAALEQHTERRRRRHAE